MTFQVKTKIRLERSTRMGTAYNIIAYFCYDVCIQDDYINGLLQDYCDNY